jgi:hypothetical protein
MSDALDKLCRQIEELNGVQDADVMYEAVGLEKNLFDCPIAILIEIEQGTDCGPGSRLETELSVLLEAEKMLLENTEGIRFYSRRSQVSQ